MPENIELPFNVYSVSTENSFDVTSSTAKLSGHVKLANSGSEVNCGIIFGTSSSLSISDNKRVTTSSGSFTITLTALNANTKYYYRAFAVDAGVYKYGKVNSFTTSKPIEAVAVDLGLSVKWASCNVGASVPEGYGGYYAWGETEEKSNYTPLTYKYYLGDLDGDGYYNASNEYQNIGSDISCTSYDVAHVKWGGSWRMPTWNEINELCNKCSWEWTEVNGINGQKVTGPNGNSIFLPAAGLRNGTEVDDRGSYGFYWSGALDESSNFRACGFYFFGGYGCWAYWDYRLYGLSVRPVTD